MGNWNFIFNSPATSNFGDRIINFGITVVGIENYETAFFIHSNKSGISA